MPEYIGPVFATLRDFFSIQFVGNVFLLMFIFGIIISLIRR